MLKARLKSTLSAPIHVATAMELHCQDEVALGKKLTEGDIFRGVKTVAYEFETLDFDCTLVLHLDLVSNPLSPKHHWYGAQKVDLTVRSEAYTTDDLVGDRWPSTHDAFIRAAYTILNRLISYCRYELGYPFMRPINISNVDATDWLDSSGEVVKTEGPFHVVDFFPGVPNTERSLGSQYLTPNHEQALRNALTAGVTASIHQELLAFARDSVYEGHALKAVLLLAIAAEVAIKMTFFQQDSLASVAFDYLEEKRQVEITPKELIDKVAKRVGGSSFAEHDADAYREIDYLFRCRNKVAHRARAEFKDDAGALHQADEARLFRWWQAVESLLRWLPQLRLKQ